jgi:hypothetical protein
LSTYIDVFINVLVYSRIPLVLGKSRMRLRFLTGTCVWTSILRLLQVPHPRLERFIIQLDCCAASHLTFMLYGCRYFSFILMDASLVQALILSSCTDLRKWFHDWRGFKRSKLLWQTVVAVARFFIERCVKAHQMSWIFCRIWWSWPRRPYHDAQG